MEPEEIFEPGSKSSKISALRWNKYGYLLSKKIMTPESSNLVYRLMKLLEYLFLTLLYFCCRKPEEKISK
ncbi:DUF6688 family protein [Pedobacter petrophilus]|uniref:DUF6688 family protein n=1 Tax=Pedobacter petrophilus TaxID=1908241 RepID=UPI00363E5F86